MKDGLATFGSHWKSYHWALYIYQICSLKLLFLKQFSLPQSCCSWRCQEHYFVFHVLFQSNMNLCLLESIPPISMYKVNFNRTPNLFWIQYYSRCYLFECIIFIWNSTTRSKLWGGFNISCACKWFMALCMVSGISSM